MRGGRSALLHASVLWEAFRPSFGLFLLNFNPLQVQHNKGSLRVPSRHTQCQWPAVILQKVCSGETADGADRHGAQLHQVSFMDSCFHDMASTCSLEHCRACTAPAPPETCTFTCSCEWSCTGAARQSRPAPLPGAHRVLVEWMPSARRAPVASSRARARHARRRIGGTQRPGSCSSSVARAARRSSHPASSTATPPALMACTTTAGQHARPLHPVYATFHSNRGWQCFVSPRVLQHIVTLASSGKSCC